MILEELKDFSNQTSIHGLGQIADDGAPVIKRIIWLAIFVASLVYAVQQLASTIEEWIDEPVIDILDSASFPIEKVEFPTATLCPKSSNSDRLGPVIKTFDYLPSFDRMKNSSERELFQAITLKVNKHLRKRAEENYYLALGSWRNDKLAISIARKFALNETNGNIILDKLWKKYGSFQSFHLPELDGWTNFLKKIQKEVESLNESQLPYDSSVGKYIRSLEALFSVSNTFPSSPSLYFAYHFNIIFGKGSYLGFNKNWAYWFSGGLPFGKQPDELTSTLNDYFVDITTHLSHGKLYNVSILDLPSFGSMIDSLENSDCNSIPWSIQLNMAIYNKLEVMNISESKWTEAIFWECFYLKSVWNRYLNDPTKNNYPSKIKNNTFFNHTNYIKKDMTTFLAAYASSIKISIPKISNNWIRIANRSFEKITLKNHNQIYYDKLIMSCTFQKPLMKDGVDFIEGCNSFDHSLTSNGLCHTYNGIETLHLLKQKWKTTEINKAVGSVFEKISRPKRTFRGAGDSEGLNLVVNMKPNIHFDSALTSHLSYTIKISTKNNLIDQKRRLVELKPGYHLVIRVFPKVIETTRKFEAFDTNTRNCKLSHESSQLKFLKNYTKIGCEFECALKKATTICKCFPWYYPNDFTEVPICDMFAARCFDDIMSNVKYYKDCNDECLEDCQGISYVAVPSYVPLNLAETCQQKLFKDFFFYNWETNVKLMMFEYLTMGKWKKYDGSFEGYSELNQLCQEYVKNYVSIVSIETPTDTVIKSTRVRRVSFNEQLAAIGGTLGLLTGMSFLSIIEILCFCFSMAKRISQAGQTKFCKKTFTNDVEACNSGNEGLDKSSKC